MQLSSAISSLVVDADKSHTIGITPSIVLSYPKYARNVATAMRNASAYGYRQVWFSGDRVIQEIESGLERGKYRLPREERMKGYSSVSLVHSEYPLHHFKDCVPVCVEIVPGAVPLHNFSHPARAVYVFGPEDGSVDGGIKSVCHHHIYIPTLHCLNLAVAIGIVLEHRAAQRDLDGIEPRLTDHREHYYYPTLDEGDEV